MMLSNGMRVNVGNNIIDGTDTSSSSNGNTSRGESSRSVDTNDDLVEPISSQQRIKESLSESTSGPPPVVDGFGSDTYQGQILSDKASTSRKALLVACSYPHADGIHEEDISGPGPRKDLKMLRNLLIGMHFFFSLDRQD